MNFFLATLFKILFKDLSLDLWVMIIIDDDFLFLFGFWTNLLIETLFFEKILDSYQGVRYRNKRKTIKTYQNGLGK